MSNIEIIKSDDIKNKIYTIRGVQVMLDKDLAVFYEVKPIRLREQVKRNKRRFPSDFMFQLSEKEVDIMVSQNAIPSKQRLGGYLRPMYLQNGLNEQVTEQADEHVAEQAILNYCTRSSKEIMKHLNLKHREHFRSKILKPLIESRKLLMTIPEKPKSPKQKYYSSGKKNNV